jgi:hypothetical protein
MRRLEKAIGHPNLAIPQRSLSFSSAGIIQIQVEELKF